jgi:cytidylate kinase
MTKKINIAIDGYSSCGKGTLAKSLAKKLNYIFIDSGSMYRAVALYLLENDIPVSDIERVGSELKGIELDFKFNAQSDQFEIHLNQRNVSKRIKNGPMFNRILALSLNLMLKAVVRPTKLAMNG